MKGLTIPHPTTIFGWLISGFGAIVVTLHATTNQADKADLYVGAGCIFLGAYVLQNGQVKDLFDSTITKLPFTHKDT